MVCPAEPWPVFSLGEFSWQNFDPLAVTPISAFYLVSEISSTCLPSLATSSNFWPSKSSRQTRWGLCGAYLRLMLILMVMLLLMFFLKLINRWGRCGICGKSTNRGGCSGWGRTWPKNIYLNIANGTSVPGVDCFNQSANSAFYFLTFEKADSTIFTLSVSWLVFLLFLLHFSSYPQRNIFLLQIFSSLSFAIFALLQKKYYILQIFVLPFLLLH